MIANPKIEIVSLDKGNWIRVTGEAIEDKRVEAKQAMFDASPYLQNQYSLDDDTMAVFYIDNLKASVNGFGGKVQVLA